jgi:hypothetical protein
MNETPTKSLFSEVPGISSGDIQVLLLLERGRSFHMNTLHIPPELALDTKQALSAQSMQEPVFLDNRRVHVVGSMCAVAGLRILLSVYPDPKGRYIYDPTESYLVGWETVQTVLTSTRTFQPDQVEKEVRHRSWCPTELHALGIRTKEHGILRFAPFLDHAPFVRLTRWNGLPEHWCAWHQHTTYGWPDSLQMYPVITQGMWQRLLTGAEPEWDSSFLLQQDPVPLLEAFVELHQVTKTLRIIPATITDANAYVKLYHRHCEPVMGAQYALAVADASGVIRGVAILGRPIARALDVGRDGEMKRRVLEVRRVATDGTRNVNSMLYAASARLAREAGYEKIITYTLAEEESGASLRAAGWVCVATTEPHQWDNRSRSRKHSPLYDLPKYRWECALNGSFPFERILFPTDRTWQGMISRAF